MGRPPAARLDAAAHQRRGRHRALGVPGPAGVPHRRVVRPLGLGQPLRAQDALRREAHGGLLLLAREGVGRALPGPGRRHRRARRRGAHRHAGRAGGDRERPRRGRRDRPPAAHHPQRDLRGRGGRGRLRDLDPAGLERAAGGARAAPARLVRGPDQVPRPRRAAGRLGRPLHRHRRAGLRPLRARAVDLVPRPGHRRAGLLLQHDRDGPDGLAAGHPPARRAAASSPARRAATRSTWSATSRPSRRSCR